MGAEDPRVSAASIIKIELPDEEEPFIPYAASMGVAFLHGAAVTIHKAQGSQWEDVQVFAPDLFVAARMGRTEAGIALWKRLAYVAITMGAPESATRPFETGRAARPPESEDTAPAFMTHDPFAEAVVRFLACDVELFGQRFDLERQGFDLTAQFAQRLFHVVEACAATTHAACRSAGETTRGGGRVAFVDVELKFAQIAFDAIDLVREVINVVLGARRNRQQRHRDYAGERDRAQQS